jgi:DNA-directed RNA polymerase subunit N (RpoN/RPB10)
MAISCRVKNHLSVLHKITIERFCVNRMRLSVQLLPTTAPKYFVNSH